MTVEFGPLSRLMCGAVAVLGLLIAPVTAKEPIQKTRRGNEARPAQDAMIVARIRIDGRTCPTGAARLRPVKGGVVDRSRFVSVGDVVLHDEKPGLQAMAEGIGKAMTLDISGLLKENGPKALLDRFVPIAPGPYVVTSVTCRSGQSFTRLGDDHANAFAAEAGQAIPVRGANFIEVQSGEILDAGILEIQSDNVGFFEAKTGSMAASPSPETEQVQIRDAFREAGRKIRFTTFVPRQ